jgi:hypothetical protein
MPPSSGKYRRDELQPPRITRRVLIVRYLDGQRSNRLGGWLTNRFQYASESLIDMRFAHASPFRPARIAPDRSASFCSLSRLRRLIAEIRRSLMKPARNIPPDSETNNTPHN